MDTVEIERLKGQIKAHQRLIDNLLEHVCVDLDDTSLALLANSIEGGIPADAISEEQRAKKRVLACFAKQVDRRCRGLTFRRKEQAKDILDEYAARLRDGEDMNGFESRLRECWNMGYQSLKPVIVDMFENHPEYKDIAVHYMKASPGPPVEFRKSLDQFLVELSHKGRELELPKDLQAELDSDIATVQAQVRSPRPKGKIVKESLSSIKRVLENASGSVAAELLKSLSQLF